MKSRAIKFVDVLIIIGGLLAFFFTAVSLMGCQPRAATSILDKQMQDLENRQAQARADNEALAARSEQQRKLICVQAASGVGYAQFQVLILQGFGIFCKSGE